MPRLGLSVMVREGMDAATLRRAVGHVPSTALPGQMGNFVVIAHRDTFFRPLRELEKGDTVQVVGQQQHVAARDAPSEWTLQQLPEHACVRIGELKRQLRLRVFRNAHQQRVSLPTSLRR